MTMHQAMLLILGAGAIVNAGGCERSRVPRWASATDDEVFLHMKPATLNLLAQAQAAINEDRLEDAEKCLSLGEQADRQTWSSRMTDALRGEIALRTGCPAEAVAVAKRIVAENPRSCLGSELLGKALLQTGDWAEAERCFQEILQQRTGEATERRTTDYLSLVAGLKSYAEGEIEEASASWRQISDPEIRAAVESALSRVRAARSGS